MLGAGVLYMARVMLWELALVCCILLSIVQNHRCHAVFLVAETFSAAALLSI